MHGMARDAKHLYSKAFAGPSPQVMSTVMCRHARLLVSSFRHATGRSLLVAGAGGRASPGGGDGDRSDKSELARVQAAARRAGSSAEQSKGNIIAAGAACEADESLDDVALAKMLNESALVVVSHGVQADPVLNYGNRAALRQWETDWTSLTSMPSRLTAEPMEQLAREQFLRSVASAGFTDDYRGTRISTRGRRFPVHATVWNVVDRDGRLCGQAAAFQPAAYLVDDDERDRPPPVPPVPGPQRDARLRSAPP